MSVATDRLADHCQLITKGTTPTSVGLAFVDQGVPFLRVGNVSHGSVNYMADTLFIDSHANSVLKRSQIVPGDVLLSIAGTIGRAGVVPGCAPAMNCNQALAIIRTRDSVDRQYLRYWLESRQAQAQMAGATVTGTIQNLSLTQVGELRIPLPPLPEQRRIATILDQADALRAKRREALAQLDSLTQSIFIEMFGDPAAHSTRWPLVRFATKLSAPLRNGLSPSSVGKVQAKVLTLAAITGDDFDPSALKLGTFVSAPPAGQAVDERDFLICRGNGNMSLVGKGHFPDANMPDVTFPDTMIAARISRTEIGPAYLQTLWNSPAVRLQIEGLARTTNGTYKVNQPMLEGVLIADPPFSLQDTFATRIQAVESLKTTHRAALAESDALFASLQHRAFAGQLSA